MSFALEVPLDQKTRSGHHVSHLEIVQPKPDSEARPVPSETGKDGIQLAAYQPREPVGWGHRLWFWGPVLLLLLSGLLRTGEGRQVLLPWCSFALPETCAMRLQFGVDCPGCGLTRGLIHGVHGDWGAAWQVNPVSLLVLAYVVLQIPLAWVHRRRVWQHRLAALVWWNERALIVLALVLVVRWLMLLVMGELY